ncbi:MAG: CoA pyrophosphatase [Candidatus Eisenbacteria bacterium]|nr:CoA pyrophosphatase [Candidatus Eisenbacteria bacterium]
MSDTPLVESAVLVPFVRDDAGEWRLVVIRRTPGGMHSGQLAFPGGRIDPADESALHAALREAEEEIGLPRLRVRVLGELPRIETRTTGFAITPFLAIAERPAAWLPAVAEVAEILEPRLAHLSAPEARRHADDLLPRGWEAVRLPYFDVNGHRLWGASERILHPLLARVAAGEWPELLG